MDIPPKRKYKKHKRGYTISVVHQLRKDRNLLRKLVSKQDSDSELRLMPIYVRVIFLQQTTVLPSRLSEELTEADFDSYLANPDVARFVEYEAEAIRYSVNDFGPDKVKDFTMSQWITYYKSWNEPIKEVVENIIGRKLMNELQVDPDTYSGLPPEIAVHIGVILSKLDGILFLGNRMSTPIAQRYIHQFEPLFQMSKFEGEVSKIADFTMWDWRLGHYQKHIRDLNDEASAGPYLECLETLLNEYSPEI